MKGGQLLVARLKTVALWLSMGTAAFVLYCAVLGWLGDRHRTSSASSAGLGMQVKSGALCNAGHCESALMVSGYLDEGFVTRFAATAEDQIKSAKWICIDSPGGKPSEGLVLAKFLQMLGKQTCVAPIRRPDATLQATKCASSCALAFAGGARRVLADDHSLGVHRAFLNDGAACIPCNYVASPLIHWIYGAIARHELDEPAIVSRMIEKSSEYPERFDTNPFKAHWVHRADFIGWGLGAQADFDSGWHFVEATSKPSI